MGAAAAAYALWAKGMKHNPQDPDWVDRDRFILGAGHGYALLYYAPAFFGYGLSLEDLKSFRQWGLKSPGHPNTAYQRC
jgi:transketolase